MLRAAAGEAGVIPTSNSQGRLPATLCAPGLIHALRHDPHGRSGILARMKRILLLLTPLMVAASALLAQAPKLEVEPLWPKPFPVAKHWILGSVTGVATDAQDRVWVVHRGVDSLQANEKGPTLEPWASSCCYAAPQLLEFDAAGTLLGNWDPKGGSGYDWPVNPSGIAVDAKGNIWIGSGLAP